MTGQSKWIAGVLAIVGIGYAATNTQLTLVLATVASGNSVTWRGKTLDLAFGEFVVPPRDSERPVIGKFGVREGLLEIEVDRPAPPGSRDRADMECEARKCTALSRRSYSIDGKQILVVEQIYPESDGSQAASIRHTIERKATVRFFGAIDAYPRMTDTVNRILSQVLADDSTATTP